MVTVEDNVTGAESADSEPEKLDEVDAVKHREGEACQKGTILYT